MDACVLKAGSYEKHQTEQHSSQFSTRGLEVIAACT